MSETVAAIMFLAVGAPCGAIFGTVAPIAERSRLALFFTDLFLAVASGSAYILTAHFRYGGRVEFWSAGVFAAALFVSYACVRCLTKAAMFFIEKLKGERKKTEKTVTR